MKPLYAAQVALAALSATVHGAELTVVQRILEVFNTDRDFLVDLLAEECGTRITCAETAAPGFAFTFAAQAGEAGQLILASLALSSATSGRSITDAYPAEGYTVGFRTANAACRTCTITDNCDSVSGGLNILKAQTSLDNFNAQATPVDATCLEWANFFAAANPTAAGEIVALGASTVCASGEAIYNSQDASVISSGLTTAKCVSILTGAASASQAFTAVQDAAEALRSNQGQANVNAFIQAATAFVTPQGQTPSAQQLMDIVAADVATSSRLKSAILQRSGNSESTRLYELLRVLSTETGIGKLFHLCSDSLFCATPPAIMTWLSQSGENEVALLLWQLAAATANPGPLLIPFFDQETPQPSAQPSNQPTLYPTGQPTDYPTSQPSNQPTKYPTSQPSNQPSAEPTSNPVTAQPTSNPVTAQPTSNPVEGRRRRQLLSGNDLVPYCLARCTTAAPTLPHPTTKPTAAPTSEPACVTVEDVPYVTASGETASVSCTEYVNRWLEEAVGAATIAQSLITPYSQASCPAESLSGAAQYGLGLTKAECKLILDTTGGIFADQVKILVALGVSAIQLGELVNFAFAEEFGTVAGLLASKTGAAGFLLQGAPTFGPTSQPTATPTKNPVRAPTRNPVTSAPTRNPVVPVPTQNPTSSPSAKPTTAGGATSKPTTKKPTTKSPTKKSSAMVSQVGIVQVLLMVISAVFLFA